jgi:hypothetical protein
MAVALSLLFEGAAADAVRAVWAALAEAGESRDMLELQYPPHLTLMVAEDEGFMPFSSNASPDLRRWCLMPWGWTKSGSSRERASPGCPVATIRGWAACMRLPQGCCLPMRSIRITGRACGRHM